jgi:1-acyl-sn-glycerol-3-phosphate acyltransferase
MTSPLKPEQGNFRQLAPSIATRAPRVLKANVADRSRLGFYWYRMVQWYFSTLLSACYGLRVTGRKNVPEIGAAMLVSNHLSHLDVLVIGILLNRPLNYVARSSLFFFPLGPFIRSCGAFPIQREGIGAQGLKETLRRLKFGGIVTLFPEGTRSSDGELGELKAGIALLAAKARVPILPAAIVGTFEAWPKFHSLPSAYPIRVHFGTPIQPEEVGSMSPEGLTSLIRKRILECQVTAREALSRSLSDTDW